MTPCDITKMRDRLQEAFGLTYDEGYALAVAIEHATQCEEARLDIGRLFVNSINTAIQTILEGGKHEHTTY